MEFLKKLLNTKFREDMTLDEVSNALQELNVGFPTDLSNYIEKAKYDNLSSEVAEYKRKERESLSEQERRDLECKEKIQELEESNKNYLKEKNISEYTSNYVKLGYSDELAKETAIALNSGDMVKVFECQTKFNKELSEKLKIDNLNDLGGPKVNNEKKVMTKEKFDKLNATQQMEFYNENPQVASEFMKI